MKHLVVIPTYNERQNIGKIIQAIFRLRRFDIFVVDDHSPDGTATQVRELIKKFPRRLHLIEREKKLGLGSAYVAGFRFALDHGADLVFSMDADFSHDPEHLERLLAGANDADVVLGSRYIKNGKIMGWEWKRYWLSTIANIFTRYLLGLAPHDVTTGFRCYRREFLRSLPIEKIVSSGYAFQVEMVMRAHMGGYRVKEVPITFRDRLEGQSKVSRSELWTSARSVLHLATLRPLYRQMVKFAIVGVTSVVIDFGILNLLVLSFHQNVYFSATISFILASLNGFTWNSIWTFRKKGIVAHASARISKELPKFLSVGIVGLGLNIAIMYALVQWFGLWYNFAKLIAVVIVFFWNFTASKLWAFKR